MTFESRYGRRINLATGNAVVGRMVGDSNTAEENAEVGEMIGMTGASAPVVDGQGPVEVFAWLRCRDDSLWLLVGRHRDGGMYARDVSGAGLTLSQVDSASGIVGTGPEVVFP